MNWQCAKQLPRRQTYLWLGHAVGELDFIVSFMKTARERLESGAPIDTSIELYREAVSAPFMEELKDRAKASARLSPVLGPIVAPVLYKTFLATDRVYRLRGASPDIKFSPDMIADHLVITETRIEDLLHAREAVPAFLTTKGIMLTSKDD